MDAFGQGVRTPLVVERSAIVPIHLGSPRLVMDHVPCIHATFIDVMWRSDVDLATISLVFGTNESLHTDPAKGIIYTAGAPDAGDTNSARWGGSLPYALGALGGQPIGSWFSVYVTPGAGVGAGVIYVWAAARS